MKRRIKKGISLIMALILVITAVMCSVLFSGCGKTIYPTGYFYSLAEAYRNGWVSRDDLMRIAYIQREEDGGLYTYEEMYEAIFGDQDEYGEDFVPAEKSSQALDAETEEKIKEAYAKELRTLPEYPDASTDDVSIYGYCGSYNGYVSVMMTDRYQNYDGGIGFNSIEGCPFPVIVALAAPLSDIATLLGDAGFGIFVWKEGPTEEFCTLQTAYTQGLLSDNDIKNISYYQRENYLTNWSQNYIPATKIPEVLSDETEMKIRQTIFEIEKERRPDATIDEITIYAEGYYGIYNDCVVLIGGGWLDSRENIVIGDVLFINTPYALQVWMENKG